MTIHIYNTLTRQKEEFVPLDQTIKNSQKDTSAETKKQLETTEKGNIEEDISFNLVKIFQINDLDTICQLSVILKGFYYGNNSLYKNKENNKYYLILNKNQHSPEDFNKTCNIVSEYGVSTNFSTGSEQFFEEHYQVIVKNNAIQVLSEL